MHVTCHALPVRSQRASNGSGASQRAEQNSSAYHSSDNETDTRINIHTHTHTHLHIYTRVLSSTVRKEIAYLLSMHFHFFFLFRWSFFSVSFSERARDRLRTAKHRRQLSWTRVSRRSRFVCAPVRRDHPWIVTHTHKHAYTYVTKHCDVSAVIRAVFMTCV